MITAEADEKFTADPEAKNEFSRKQLSVYDDPLQYPPPPLPRLAAMLVFWPSWERHCQRVLFFWLAVVVRCSRCGAGKAEGMHLEVRRSKKRLMRQGKFKTRTECKYLLKLSPERQ